jgi:hypothetical protein
VVGADRMPPVPLHLVSALAALPGAAE